MTVVVCGQESMLQGIPMASSFPRPFPEVRLTWTLLSYLGQCGCFRCGWCISRGSIGNSYTLSAVMYTLAWPADAQMF